MLKIEYVPIGDLKPYENNAKIHTDEQIEQIKKSIQEFGFNDPIAVWKDGEIIEGHGRLFAAKQLGLKEVPIIDTVIFIGIGFGIGLKMRGTELVGLMIGQYCIKFCLALLDTPLFYLFTRERKSDGK